jgi:hypothetical protein
VTAVDQFQVQTEALAADTQRQVLAVYAAWQAGQISQADAELAIAGIINRANAAGVTMADVFVAAQIEEAARVPVPTTGVAPIDDSARLAQAVHTILTAPPKAKLTRAEVSQIITNGGLDPKDWDVAAITKDTNATIHQKIIDMTGGEEHGPLAGVDFFETVAETAPAGAPAEKLWADLEAGKYDDTPPVWEPEPEAADMRLERLARAEPLETAQRASVDAMAAQPLVEGWTRAMDADPCQLCVWWWREGRIWPKAHPFQSHKGCNCTPKVVLAKSIQSTGFTRQLERNRAS